MRRIRKNSSKTSLKCVIIFYAISLFDWLISPLVLTLFSVCFLSNDLQEDYNEIVGGWNAKLIRSSSGEQRWGLFIAKKN